MKAVNLKAGFIILNYNSLEDSISCIDSLVCNTIPESDIVFVENSNLNSNCEKVRDKFNAVNVICSGENLGYAGGNNLGINFLYNKGYDYFVIINNDCVVLDTSFIDLLPLLTNSVGIFGLNISDSIVFKNTEVKESLFYRLFFKHGIKNINDEQNKMWFSKNYVSGAGMIISRALVDKIGFLEERYFLYCEEIDYCYKARFAGFNVVQDNRKIISFRHERGKSHDKPYVWYYLSRNIFNLIRFNDADKKHYFMAPIVIVKYIVRNLLVKNNVNRFRINYLIIKGCIDGLVRKKFGYEKNV